MAVAPSNRVDLRIAGSALEDRRNGIDGGLGNSNDATQRPGNQPDTLLTIGASAASSSLSKPQLAFCAARR